MTSLTDIIINAYLDDQNDETILAYNRALNVIKVLRENGFVIVPENPTPEMGKAAEDDPDDCYGTYTTMIEVAISESEAT